MVLKEFYTCFLNVQHKISCWQIFIKTVEEKGAHSRDTWDSSSQQETQHPETKLWHSPAQTYLFWPTFSSHGKAVLGRDAEMIYLFPLCGKDQKKKKKKFWLQYCDSAIVEGGINYLVYLSQISVTVNWRCYRAWVRKCRDTGVLVLTDERKDWQAWSMNELCGQYQRLPIRVARWLLRWTKPKLSSVIPRRK